jgi:hypothetical protein
LAYEFRAIEVVDVVSQKTSVVGSPRLSMYLRWRRVAGALWLGGQRLGSSNVLSLGLIGEPSRGGW